VHDPAAHELRRVLFFRENAWAEVGIELARAGRSEGAASAKLYWQIPGVSKVIVPAKDLYTP